MKDVCCPNCNSKSIHYSTEVAKAIIDKKSVADILQIIEIGNKETTAFFKRVEKNKEKMIIMDELKNKIMQLNQLLDKPNSADVFNKILSELKLKYKFQFQFYDNKLYSEELKIGLQEAKINAVKSQNFEEANILRDNELTCQKYLKFKSKLNLEQSLFYLEENILYYFHFGNALNDKIFKTTFNKLN